MAFEKKTWKDRVSEFPTRRILTALSDSSQAVYEIERYEGAVAY